MLGISNTADAGTSVNTISTKRKPVSSGGVRACNSSWRRDIQRFNTNTCDRADYDRQQVDILLPDYDDPDSPERPTRSKLQNNLVDQQQEVF
jgi:hypothetical protein